MRDVGKFTQSKPGNRFRAPMGAVSLEVLYGSGVGARIAASLCNANEKQKIANRQYYGRYPSNSIFANDFRNALHAYTKTTHDVIYTFKPLQILNEIFTL